MRKPSPVAVYLSGLAEGSKRTMRFGLTTEMCEVFIRGHDRRPEAATRWAAGLVGLPQV